MLLTDLLNKKIINIYDGEFLGQLGEADLLINEQNGNIETMIIQKNKKILSKSAFSDNFEKHIPWSSVKKIGGEIIIVDFEYI